MSKKKTFSGSTMTLKDFHGGSIPADISLPSAPGVIVRPTDRPVYDRPSTWGNSMGGRSEHRLRPSSSGSMRSLDENKTPFLTSTVNIGRNFDEDERKPLDGGASAPRRTVNDDSIGASVVRSEPRVVRVDSGKLSGQPSLGPVAPQMGGVSGSSYSARVVEGGHSSVGVSSRPNAWGARKEPRGVGEPDASPWSGQSTVSKFAQASALDQISSGRWQTKPLQQQVDIEVIKPLDSRNSLYGRENDPYVGGVNFMSEREYYETTLVGHVERGLAIEEAGRGGFKEMPGVERVHSPVQSSVLFTNEGQPAYPDGKSGGPELQHPPEVGERPKLKLLPRSKPLDAQELSGIDYRQGCQLPNDTNHSEVVSILGNGSHVKPIPTSSEARHGNPGVSGSESGHRVVERPKLNLKPRSQPVDHSDGGIKKERKSLFGGARPREMVLKARGVDDVITSHDQVLSPSRMKNDSPRSELAPAPANTSRQGEKVDNLSIDQRTGRGHEKRDQRADTQKADTQRKNWRNENWRSGRDTEKHQQERQPSPETWRKPVEHPNASNGENSGLRFGKAVSAVDLAQAFSRSVSDPKPVDQLSGQRGLPSQKSLPGQKGLPVRSQMPFSRLMGPTTRPQINGY
ncbi:hypothetical protein BVRB_8g201920 [Beta vulgaris subsp. vulgaris]|uniref:Uncharacterized protein n=1 Tax=Beta vulgaris subsp. vulgaris TaxID=3555 RepID=A0A0J8B9N2_BETVV|nr:hypothetical protein BVRB_8g201920 [Beta vulgaris subsp. vulgaris]